MPIEEQACVASLLAAYLAADYQWEHDGAGQALRIGQAAPAIESLFPDALQFGMLSAWNPGSVQVPDLVNRGSDRRLQARLAATGLDFRSGFAAAPNGSWREPNWVVAGISPRDLDALARDFGQRGSLHWQRARPVTLRMYAARPDTVAGQACVDWVP